jgi:phycobilisome rod-core linker protein
MSIPLLEYAPTTQNQRVKNFEIPGDEYPRAFTTEDALSSLEIDSLIRAAYRQIFNEQQTIERNRQKALESQLKSRQITVRDFIRGLLLSESFRRYNYEPNNNYRFVRLCIQRLLGREPFGEREILAWSTVLATKGLQGFVDAILNSAEYRDNFGFDTVPYQRRRVLPQRAIGNLPQARTPRYDASYRQQLEQLGYFRPARGVYRWRWQEPPYPAWVGLTGKIITAGGAIVLTLVLIAVALDAWGLISL